MPEYVYALHDFLPEHEDEVPFHAGERIEVVEKDDAYGDGWWQGRNLTGRVGLFPQSYTAPAPPTSEPEAPASPSTSDTPLTDADTQPTNSSLQPLHEESESESPPTNGTQPPAIYLNGNETADDAEHKDGEVMKATMTDVQQAIEQLGRGRGLNEDGDGARSFSFASSRDDRDTEIETDDTDFDMSDVDGTDAGDDGGGEGWHKGARRKLAAKARRAVEEAEKLEMMMGESRNGRTAAPPIEVELSDESEGEDDHHHEDYTSSSAFTRRHSFIPEEDEEAEMDGPNGHSSMPSEDTNTLAQSTTSGTIRTSTDEHSTQITLPERDETELQTATAKSFPSAPSPTEEQTRASLPTPSSPEATFPPAPVVFPVEQKRNSAPYRESLIALPSPSQSHFSEPSKHNSVASASSSHFPSHASAPSPSLLQPPPIDDKKDEKDKVPPSEWSVEEVVEWLRSRGFGPDVYDKFTEQEITGDVLIELDVNLLKNEIGIMAYGKRVRIANAITDLRRPPSIVYSDHQDLPSPSSPMLPQLHSPGIFTQSPHSLSYSYTSQSAGHSRNQSTSQSHHSYPGTTTQSLHSSINGHGMGLGSAQMAALISPESAPYTGEISALPAGMAEPVVRDFGNGNGMEGLDLGVGLGIDVPQTNGRALKPRPAQLALSPSDSNLNAKAVSDIAEDAEEERAALSEGEALPTSTSMRRRLFGRSHDSAISGKDSAKESTKGSGDSRHSKEGLSPVSLLADKEKEKDKDSASTNSRHTRNKKSVDGTKHDNRLSIFGTLSTGNLGKSRKPPPRYSVLADDGTQDKDRSSSFHLPRLYSSGPRKSSGRPSTPGGSNKNSPKELKEKDKPKDSPASPKDTTEKNLLRKRTSSYPSTNGSVSANGGANAPQAKALAEAAHAKSLIESLGPLKPGQSILEQIGEPDHQGFMRKKGDRYNSWKLRYFVLKGPHLYWLRSDSKTETKIKGYVNILGYKVTVDENVNPGRYGFRIEHDNDKMHFFSSDEKTIVRDWMKAIMKATIGRDYTKPVISSCNIPTIPLTVAQAMNPAPRPPSPTARDATQKALRRENPNQLSSRDARVLMGLASSTDPKEERTRLESFFSNEAVDTVSLSEPKSPAPPRPSREARRLSSQQSVVTPVDDTLIDWANSHLPKLLQITDTSGSICGGLVLLRIAESVKGRPSSPPVPDSAFPTDPSDDKLDGLFRLFDFLLDNDVKMGSVSINDVRQGKRDKIVQLLRALKAWEDKRKAIAQSIGKGSVQAGGFMAPIGAQTWA